MGAELGAAYATLGFVHVRRGVLPDAHSYWTVPHAVGPARTAELFLTGRTFRGDEAVQLGIEAASLAAPAPLRDEVARLETALHHVVIGSRRRHGGVTALLEKRPPRWTLAVPRDWPADGGERPARAGPDAREARRR